MTLWFRTSRAVALLMLFEILLVRKSYGASIATTFTNVEDETTTFAPPEHHNCDHIIPRFIAQVMSDNEKPRNCETQGEFPQPGNCSVFFKCIQQSSQVIQPFVEYCAVGYIFVNGACVPNRNSSDCPQFTCRIPSNVSPVGNEIEPDDDTLLLPTHYADETLVPAASLQQTGFPTTTETDRDTTTSDMNDIAQPQREEIHSEQFMQETQTQNKKNSGISVIGSLYLCLCCILFHILK